VVLEELEVEHHNLLVVRKRGVVSMGLVVVEQMNHIQFRGFVELLERRVLSLVVGPLELRIQLVFQRISGQLELELEVALGLVDCMIRMILA